jgi:NADPH:quinone reductase-like Zn-dependent oxidoreductase
MNKFHNEHQIKLVINYGYKFEEAIEAFNHLSKGESGKIVIEVSSNK